VIIKIKNFRLKTIIGIHEWEEKIDREIIVNAEIATDFTNSLISDNISDALDYELITSKIKNLVATRKFRLVEKMAQEIMNVIMEDKRIAKCKLEIDKVGAVEFLESFSITIEQSRKNGS